MLRPGDVDGVEFLARADVEQVDGTGLVSLAQAVEFARGDLHGAVFLLAGLEEGDDFRQVHVRVARGDLGEGLGRREPARTAPADVVLAKESPLRAGVDGEQFAHGQVGVDLGKDGGHAAIRIRRPRRMHIQRL